MYILEDLWNGRVRPGEMPFPRDGEYAQALQKTIEQEKCLRACLKTEERRLLNAYEDANSLQAAISVKESFFQGFCIGVKIMLDVINNPS